MRMKKFIALVLILVTLVSVMATPASAAVDVQASQYGFHIDNSYYSITWYTSTNTMNVWKGSALIGQAYQNVGIARQKTDLSNQVVLVRLMLCPISVKSGGLWYHGINKTGEISMTLGSKQTYIDNSPDSSIIVNNDSCSFSLNGTVNNKGEFSGGLDIGASTSWSNNCFDIIAKVTNSRKTITTAYNYTPCMNFISTAGRKKINKWLNSTHKEYAMMQFRNDSTSIPEFSIKYTVQMWYADSSSKNWSGSTWDVWPITKTTTQTITYCA